jgi:Sulfotransferase family
MSIDHLTPYLDREGICPNPVFIIGSPRSGTTALGHALDRHPELWAARESYFLYDCFGNGRAGGTWQRHRERKNPSFLANSEVERAEFLGFLGLGVNALYTSRSGGLRWVDPTPLNTIMVEDLADLFPGAMFLNLVRDGRAVVRSMGRFRENLEAKRGQIPDFEMPPWTHDFRSACETWSRYVTAGGTFGAAKPDRCLTIRNEDLAADAAAGFARIQEFLGLVQDDEPGAFFGKRRINSSFSEGSSEPGWLDWAPEQRRTFAEIAGATLIEAGYADADELETWASSQPVESAAGTPRT